MDDFKTKPEENVFYCFYKITSLKNYNAGKDKKNYIYLTMAFLN